MSKVINFKKGKYASQVMDAFDQLTAHQQTAEHIKKRELLDRKSEVERKARNRF